MSGSEGFQYVCRWDMLAYERASLASRREVWAIDTKALVRRREAWEQTILDSAHPSDSIGKTVRLMQVLCSFDK